MSFRLSYAGNMFQRMANSKFVDFIFDGTMLVYFDDILIHTSTWPQHIQALQVVLQWIQHKLNLEFRKEEMQMGRFLDFIIFVEHL